jgi:hypothetical protein
MYVSVALILASLLLSMSSHTDMTSLRNVKKETRKLCRRTNRPLLKPGLRREATDFLFIFTQHPCCSVFSLFSRKFSDAKKYDVCQLLCHYLESPQLIICHYEPSGFSSLLVLRRVLLCSTFSYWIGQPCCIQWITNGRNNNSIQFNYLF